MPFTVLICVCNSRKFHRSKGQGNESQNLRCFTARFACVGAEVFSGSRYAAYACGSNFVRRLPVSLLCESEIIEGGATEIAGRKLAERDHRSRQALTFSPKETPKCWDDVTLPMVRLVRASSLFSSRNSLCSLDTEAYDPSGLP